MPEPDDTPGPRDTLGSRDTSGPWDTLGPLDTPPGPWDMPGPRDTGPWDALGPLDTPPGPWDMPGPGDTTPPRDVSANLDTSVVDPSAPSPPPSADMAAPTDTAPAQDAAPPPSHPATGVDPNGHDPDGYDPADFETPRLTVPPAVAGGPGFESIELSDFDPAEVDIRDFTGDPPAVTVTPDDVLTPPTTNPADPLRPGPSLGEATSPSIPMPRDPGGATRGGQEVSLTLTVADLSRALVFYRDALGFTVTSSAGENAIVERRGTRIRLQATTTVLASRQRVRVDVADIEASCAAAEAHEGKIIERPGPVGVGGGRQLWRARLRDPDGHAVELMQWRQGDG